MTLCSSVAVSLLLQTALKEGIKHFGVVTVLYIAQYVMLLPDIDITYMLLPEHL